MVNPAIYSTSIADGCGNGEHKTININNIGNDINSLKFSNENNDEIITNHDHRVIGWFIFLLNTFILLYVLNYKLGLFSLSFISFFCICGGPFGIELAVKAAGPLLTLSSFIALPLSKIYF